ncbi:MAG TPA: type VI secretion system baseplate subunit TssK, partial [Burkholderiales bacterium]|nr:type VI secretion system baseplate subunit TssK [Burkholderiales bacterium]
IRDEITGRARQLEGYKSPREVQKAEFDASYMLYLLALRSLNRFVPQLVHLAETPQVHPWVAYGVLRQLVGELSSFSERVNMLGEGDGKSAVPAYDHADLGRCFTAVQQLLRLLLNELTIGPELVVRLEYREADALYVADIPRDFFSSRNRYYFVLRSDNAGEPALIDEFLRESKIGASAYVPQLIARALPGIEMIHLKEPPQGLPRRANSLYFRCEQFSEQWEAVESKGDIAMHWSSAPGDLRAELVVVKR